MSNFKQQGWVAQDLQVDVHAICCRLRKTLQLPFQHSAIMAEAQKPEGLGLCQSSWQLLRLN